MARRPASSTGPATGLHGPTGPHRPIAVSVDDAVPISGLGRTKLYEAIKKKQLRSLRVGRRRLLMLDDLEKFLISHAD
jgi:excisionase family DNA binding protein